MADDENGNMVEVMRIVRVMRMVRKITIHPVTCIQFSGVGISTRCLVLFHLFALQRLLEHKTCIFYVKIKFSLTGETAHQGCFYCLCSVIILSHMVIFCFYSRVKSYDRYVSSPNTCIFSYPLRIIVHYNVAL